MCKETNKPTPLILVEMVKKSKCAYNEVLKLPLSRDALYLREPGLCVDQGPLVRLKIL